MNRAVITGIAAALLLSACATQKTWQATGGSRSDGVVRLSYEEGMFENPQTSDAQGLSEATSRCAVWGYQGAEAFGGTVRQCNDTSGGSCSRWLVTKEYQCTDGR